LNDAECVALLRWALPRLGLRYEGFRRVRRQVCRRIGRRSAALGLADGAGYRRRLEEHPEEWAVLDELCHIPISRFYRDRGVFDALRERVLPALAREACARPGARLRAWSAGCASGEEPWTLVACLAFDTAPRFPGLGFEVVATDADAALLARARRALYRPGSARELPREWIDALFERRDGALVVRDAHRSAVSFHQQDLRREAPDGPFDLVLCRNVAFTYFEAPEQGRVLARIAERLRPGGALVIGRHERLPEDAAGFATWPGAPSVHRRAPA
jgi:chemotaxis protein methyltransferase CheR